MHLKENVAQGETDKLYLEIEWKLCKREPTNKRYVNVIGSDASRFCEKRIFSNECDSQTFLERVIGYHVAAA